MDKIKKILLLQPNLNWCDRVDFKTSWEIVPQNLCILAAMLDTKYEVEILDANLENLSIDKLISLIVTEGYDLVGITMLTSEYAQAAHMAAGAAKKADKEIITVLGGIYATVSWESAIKDVNIDYLVMGEGEYVFPDLLDFLNGDKNLPEKGIACIKEGHLINHGRVEFIEDLDALPFPAYDKIQYDKYTNMIQRVAIDAPLELPYARIRTSRGCPVGCSFCQVSQTSGRKFRPRSIENIIRELKWQKEKFGIKSILFNDDNITLDMNRAKALFKAMIDNQLNLSWNATAIAVFRTDEEMIELMKKSGCQYLNIAIESANQRILKDIINKPIDLEYAKQMVKKIRSMGIYVAANFIIGFPGETWDEIRNTIRFAEEINVDYIKIFIATPLKGTKMYDMVQKNNMLYKKKNYETDLNWSESIILSNEYSSKDLSVLRAYEWDRINFSDADKRKRAAERMRIPLKELFNLRRKTLESVWGSESK